MGHRDVRCIERPTSTTRQFQPTNPSSRISLRPSSGPTSCGNDVNANNHHIYCMSNKDFSISWCLVQVHVCELELAADQPSALVAVRLCEVLPEGASARVGYGVLNLTHRDGHEEVVPREPGRGADRDRDPDDLRRAGVPGPGAARGPRGRPVHGRSWLERIRGTASEPRDPSGPACPRPGSSPALDRLGVRDRVVAPSASFGADEGRQGHARLSGVESSMPR